MNLIVNRPGPPGQAHNPALTGGAWPGWPVPHVLLDVERCRFCCNAPL